MSLSFCDDQKCGELKTLTGGSLASRRKLLLYFVMILPLLLGENQQTDALLKKCYGLLINELNGRTLCSLSNANTKFDKLAFSQRCVLIALVNFFFIFQSRPLSFALQLCYFELVAVARKNSCCKNAILLDRAMQIFDNLSLKAMSLSYTKRRYIADQAGKLKQ